jgi:hypothetical protein
MNKITLLLLFISSILYAQEDTINHSAIKHPKYLENPTEYLSKINHNLIPTQILIDRVLFNDLILKVNGKDKVTTTEYQDFYKIYQSLKLAHNDSSFFVDFDTLINFSNAVYDYDKTNIISILDFNFNRVNPQAISNGDFSELNDGLVLNRVNNNNFLTDRAITFSVFKHNIFGDDIKFQVIDFYKVLNTEKRTLQKLEIDFGNGSGFQEVTLNETITIDYYGESNYIELKLKITYLNTETLNEEVYYAHSSVFRKALSNRSQYPTEESISSVKWWVPKPDVQFDFPEKFIDTMLDIECMLDCHEEDCLSKCKFREYYNYRDYTFDVAILYSPENKATQSSSEIRKLRKPFIMVDGFDPGNKRDYEKTIHTNPDKLLEKEKDDRGLYEFLDGKRSPWDKKEETNSNMVKALQDDGYDIIFVNFRDGAGDILKNAERFQQFLNEVINSSKYRDNKTEETIVVGPSMGGLITRIALKEMEIRKEEHFVKSWISFDSPHSGAYIPLSIQYFLKLMSESEIEAIKKQGDQKLGSLKSIAAQQQLNVHILSSDKMSGTIKNNELYDYLKIIGYPNLSKRYGITNGGMNLLYEISDVKRIINFKVIPSIYGYKINVPIISVDGYALTHNRKPLNGYVLKNIKRIGLEYSIVLNHATLKVNNPITYENTPGGWHTALYSLNRSEDNFYKFNNLAEHYDKATFIPTVSAFGVPVTNETSHLSHNSFTNINDFSSGKIRTPFDAIHGMKDNEEHVKISVNTKEVVIYDWLRPDNTETTRPVIRVGEPIHQTASKPIAYLVKQEIAFAGNGNTFTFQNGADANIVTGKNIKFLPGFTIQSGAKMNAKIQVQQDVILKNATFETTNSQVNREYLNSSPYHQKVYNYDISDVTEETKSYIKLQIYPNPVQDFVNLSIEEDNDNLNTVNIHDVNGKLIYSEQIISNQNKVIDTQNWARGVYFVTVNGKNNIQKTKIVK